MGATARASCGRVPGRFSQDSAVVQGGGRGMDARRGDRRARSMTRLAPLSLAVVLPFLGGASYRTTNFVVEAPTPSAARRVAEQAESCRATIARAWLGRELPSWSTPCPIRVR